MTFPFDRNSSSLAKEFSALPFWFLNDEFSEQKIKQQLEDFKAKGIRGCVLHPRIGVPDLMPYLSDSFMKMIQYAVEVAHELDMSIVLYDEGMYPSGAAGGMVVQNNPNFAAKALTILCGDETPDGSNVIGDYIYPYADGRISLHDVLPYNNSLPNGYKRIRLAIVNSKGTIRGIHYGMDSRDKNAPKAADILNIDAVHSFIALTHERYKEWVGRYFGNTIIGIFTDEPSPMGRYPIDNAVPWSESCTTLWNDDIYKLAALFFDIREDALEKEKIINQHRELISAVLCKNFYEPILNWCKKNKIQFMGHPAEPMDTAPLNYMDVPGQDLIMRKPSPESGALTADGVLAKVVADCAVHLKRQRNLCEVLGCCYRGENTWHMPFEDVKWFLDYLFVRGCNMVIPHAFYYSVAEERYKERPPDVGPNSIWWKHYNQISDYMWRMSYINSGQYKPKVCVLCKDGSVPYKCVTKLYEAQTSFAYLDIYHIKEGNAIIKNQAICIAQNEYTVCMVEDQSLLKDPDIDNFIIAFKEAGGVLLTDNFERALEIAPRDVVFKYNVPQVRSRKVFLDDYEMVILTNESGNASVVIEPAEAYEVWLPFEDVLLSRQQVIRLQYRQSAVLYRKCIVPVQWTLAIENKQVILNQLRHWNKIKGFEAYFGMGSYSTEFTISEKGKTLLYVDKIDEFAEIYMNNRYAGTLFTAPYELDISNHVKIGLNRLNINVFNSPAVKFNKADINSGLGGFVGIRVL